jgi:hypothetical protein
MKKITLLFTLLVISFNAFAQFPETFDGPGLPATWTVFDNGVGTTVSWGYNDAGYPVVLWEDVTDGTLAEDFLVSPSYAVTASNPLLKFDLAQINDGDFNSTMSIRVQVDAAGSNITDPTLYTNIQTYQEADVLPAGFFQGAEIDLSNYIGQNIFLAFVYSNDDGDAWAIDNVEFIPLANTAPLAATNPDPADGSTVFLSQGTDANGNPVNQYVFTWQTPAGSDPATSFVFDLGVDNTVSNFSTNLSGPSLTLNGLALDSTYFWRITSENIAGSTVGNIWTFTTESVLSTNEFEVEKVLEHYISNGILTVEANQDIDNIQIYNMLGQEVRNISSDSNKNEIDLNDISTGSYIAKVFFAGQHQTFKFIKK